MIAFRMILFKGWFTMTSLSFLETTVVFEISYTSTNTQVYPQKKKFDWMVLKLALSLMP